MFLTIMKHEIIYRLRQVSTYVYFLIFLGISFGFMSLAGGAIKGVYVNMFRQGESVVVNSPTTLSVTTMMLFYFGIIVIASVFGNIAVREFENQSYSLLFSKPIKKSGYLLGKYLAGVFLSIFIFISIGIGMYLATLMPYMDANALGINHFSYYFQPYLLLVLPNVIFFGAVIFIICLHSRKILTAYITALVLFIGYMAASALTSDYANTKVASLVDPYGMSAVMSCVKYWSSYEINNNLLPFSGLILQNRLIWLSISILIFGIFAYFFKMGYQTESSKQKIAKETESSSLTPYDKSKTGFKYNSFILPALRWTKIEFTNIVKNVYFFVILVVYLFFLVTSATQIGKIFGTTTYPVTYIVVQILTGSYMIFSVILSTFYAGELIWKERINKSDQIIDAMPFKTAISFTSKFMAIIFMQMIFMLLIIVVGVITQTVSGYYHYELTQYFFDLFILRLPSIIVFTLLAMFLQTLFNNKYLGYFAIIILYGFIMLSSSLSIDHNLLIFNQATSVPYSQINGYGHFLSGFFFFKAYWIIFSLILAFIAVKIWVRGKETLLKVRFHNFFKENKSATIRNLVVLLTLFVLTGAYLFYNTNILNKYHSSKYYENQQALYEKTYKYLEKLPQPRITDVFVQADMYPAQRKLNIKGYYWLKNKTKVNISEIIVNNQQEAKDFKVTFNNPTKLKLQENDFNFYIYKLNSPLLPGDSLKIDYQGSYQEKGIKNSELSTEIVNNGTFFHNDYMPSIGYNSNLELQNNRTRKKYGLAETDRMAKINDMKARMNVYVAKDADWVKFSAIVSTSQDQIPFAPGNLVNEWKSQGRVYRQYTLTTPVLNFFTFVSGKYEVKKDMVRNIFIEIYYQKGHEYNIDTMMEAAKKTIIYCSDNFNPYPHKVLRIIEVPNYIQYAQSIPTMIPFSEGLGFIAKVDPKNPKDINYPYYVTAHEISHQWWAHQVIGANVQGSTMLSEALAQYSSLMLMKQKYGDQQMKRFLGYELDSYLMGRSNESKVENPLYLVENQQYIHYNKGSLTMYALQDNIGENNVNLALGKFCKDYAYKNPPYPVSTDLISYLSAVTPDSVSYLIDELFKKIIIYDFGIDQVKVAKKGQIYEYTIKLDNTKQEADAKGKYKPVKLHDWVEIALYEKGKDSPFYIKKYLIKDNNQSVVINVPKKAAKVEIDPIRKMIDKFIQNNSKNI